MDDKILIAFMRLAKKNFFLRIVNYFFVKFSTVIFFAAYISVGFFLGYYLKPGFSRYIAVPLITVITTYAMRLLVKKKRPYKALGYILDFNLKSKNSYSMPSNHAASSMIIAFACSYVNLHLGIILFILSIFTGFSRVFLGIHYLSDVIIGYFIALVFGVIGFYIMVYI